MVSIDYASSNQPLITTLVLALNFVFEFCFFLFFKLILGLITDFVFMRRRIIRETLHGVHCLPVCLFASDIENKSNCVGIDSSWCL